MNGKCVLTLCGVIAGCGRASLPSGEGSGKTAATTTSAHVYFDLPESYFPRGDAAALGLDGRAVDALVDQAANTRSDALVLLEDGHVVVERYFGHRPRLLSLMSITKGIVSLAIGALIDEGRIAGIDAPLFTWFPEWHTGAKVRVTLRHVLTHTSGLAHDGPAAALYAQHDRVAYARSLPLVEEPGTHFSYSNEAIELLAGVVRAAAGKPLDAYVKEKFFEPMGIVDFTWDRDDADNVQAFADLSMFPRDLAKIGQMMLDGGRWNQKQLVSQAWIAQSTAPSPSTEGKVGLIWWVDYDWTEIVQSAAARETLARMGFTPASKLASLDGRIFRSEPAYHDALFALLTAEELATLQELRARTRAPSLFEARHGTPIGFDHDGSNGQFLTVYRPGRVVAVRMHEPELEVVRGGREQYMAEQMQHGFLDFSEAVRAALRPARAPN